MIECVEDEGFGVVETRVDGSGGGGPGKFIYGSLVCR